MILKDIQARQAASVVGHYIGGGDYATLTIGSETFNALLAETSSEYDYELAAQRDQRTMNALALATAFTGILGQSWKIGQTVKVVRNNGHIENWRLQRAELSPDNTTYTLVLNDA